MLQELNTDQPATRQMKICINGFTEAQELGVIQPRSSSSLTPSSPAPLSPPSRSPSPVPSPSMHETSTGVNNWTHNQTMLLIGNYRNHKAAFSSPLLKKKEVWCRIAEEMQAKGYNINGEQCDKKWRSLKERFKKILDRHKSTGVGIGWQYFSVMEEVLADDPMVYPLFTISTDSQDSTQIHLELNDQSLSPTSLTPSRQATPTREVEKVSKKVTKRKRTDVHDTVVEFIKYQKEYMLGMARRGERLEKLEQKRVSLLEETNKILRSIANSLNKKYR